MGANFSLTKILGLTCCDNCIKYVLNALLQANIYTKYRCSLSLCLMSYYNDNGVMKRCVNIDDIECVPSSLLRVIEDKNQYHKLFHVM